MSITDTHTIDGFSGALVWPGQPGYDDARQVWNAMHDRRPAVVARCTGPGDVAAAIDHARRAGLPIAVRGGGHSLPGYGVWDDGVVIDLRPMCGVTVNPVARVGRVGGGALLAEVDAATQEHGLIVPAGVVSHTGVGGLALGGGVGRMMRRFGLTIDSLRSVQIVTADGRILRADEHAHPDLFWAVRGGGGNFGVVTEFEFDLHPVADVLVLAMFHTHDAVPDVLGMGQEVLPGAPRELSWSSFPRRAYEQPWLPAELVGTHGALTFAEWSGDLDEGRGPLEDLARDAAPVAHAISTIPYLVLQTLNDELYSHGKRSFFKSAFVDALTPEVTAVLTARAAEIRSPFTQLEVLGMGGAVTDVPVGATAFPNRSSQWLVNVPATWLDAGEDAEHRAWVRETYRDLEPFMADGSYVNFMDADEKGSSEASVAGTVFAGTLDRLRRVKAQYDPQNVFRLNQNITPAP